MPNVIDATCGRSGGVVRTSLMGGIATLTLTLAACAGQAVSDRNGDLDASVTDASLATAANATSNAAPSSGNGAAIVANDPLRLTAHDGVWTATHPRQRFSTTIDAAGAHLRDLDGAWSVGAHLARIGRDGALRLATAPRASQRGVRVELARDGVVEWFSHDLRGVEEGLDVTARSPGDGALVAEIAFDGLSPIAAPMPNEVSLVDAEGHVRLTMNRLSATDADGRALTATLAANGAVAVVRVDDHDARYPIAIDPVIWGSMISEGTLTPASGDYFGGSVAVVGDIAAIGGTAHYNTTTKTSSGSAGYIFSRSGTSWTQTFATPNLGGGATAEGNGASPVALTTGYAFLGGKVYEYSGGWAPTQTLGGIMAVSGTEFVLGEESALAAYTYTLSGTTWSKTSTLNDPSTADNFGAAVGIGNGTIVVANTTGTVSTYSDLGSGGASWTALPSIPYSTTTTDGPPSVAVDGQTVVIGATTATAATALVYVWNGSGWSYQATLQGATSNPAAGVTVAISGDSVVVGAPAVNQYVYPGPAGTAYVFQRSGTTWSTVQSLTSPGSGASDGFGTGVAIDKGTVVVGAPYRTVGANTYLGLAFVYFAPNSTGDSCIDGAQCQTGNCVNGVCCSSASCAAGFSCNSPGNLGTCVGANGVNCGAGSQCASGNCVDGVCCNTACDPSQQCQACNVPGAAGTCTTITSGGQPTSTRTACAVGSGGDSVCSVGSCNGSDISTCHFPGSATTCAAGPKCSGASELDPNGCNGSGACTFTTKSCGVFVCEGGSCATSCTSNTDCSTGYFCSGGNCASLEGAGGPCTGTNDCGSGLTCVNGACCTSSSCPNGTCNGSHPGTCTLNNAEPCTASSQCTSGACFDKVCCNVACGGQCQSCNAVGGTVGVCQTITGAPVGGRAACSNDGTTCGAGSCSGANPTACTLPTGTTPCGSASCSGTSAISAGTCNGAGKCASEVTTPCGAYACSGGACKTTCGADTDCGAGYYCTGGNCTVKGGNGASCTAGDQCSSSYCVDNTCCGTASCGTGAHCNVAGFAGKCIEPAGATCTTNAQCSTNFCADGYCCNTACTGECEACDLSGATGVCTPVTGAPHGSRAACTPGTGDPACSSATCNGALRTACSLPSGNACGGTCTSGTATTTGSCDGTGKCSGETTITCAPYICGTNACKTTCATDSDCSGGYCNAGECSARLPNGNTCTTGDDCTSKSCVNGVCCGSASCAGGGVCNDPAHLGSCVIEPGGACTSSSQCGTGLCVDGVCCTSSCTGSCEACNVTGSLGNCVPVTTGDKPHSSRAACAGDGTTCNTEQCDGIHTTCQYPGPAVQCGSAACASGSFEAASFCSGGGKCVASFSSGCAPYVCGTSACKTTCATNTDCASGAFCDTTGHCAYQANAGTSCGTDAACGGTLHCINNICCNSASDTCPGGGACVNRTNSSGTTELGVCKAGNGTTCTENDQCVSDFCVDGVCCNTTCGTGSADANASCGACNLPGFVGICTPVIGAPQGGRKVCNTDAPATCSSLTCTGASTSCALPTTSTYVGAASCTAGVETDPGPCDGTGGGGATTKPCGSFGCNAAGTTCNTTCAADTDCDASSFCDVVGSGTTGSCAPKGAQGSPCLSNDGCGPGLGCQDGFCCNDVTCNADEGFCGGSHPGTCLKVSGTCTADAQCSSGFCADVDATTGNGVCCDTACTGLCETCSSSESPGKCIPTVGVPAAGHGSCPAGTGDVCSGSVCDGTTRDTCAGTPGGETICEPATCTDGSGNVDITCNHSGACPTAPASPCANFRTCANATTCNQGPCTTDTDCSNDYTCDKTGHCIPKTAYCDPTDPTQSIGQDGGASSCLPYLCDTNGTCKTSCATTNDCAGGSVCNNGQCGVDSSSASKGGCAVGATAAGEHESDGWMTIGAAAAALVIGARRRRAARSV